MKTMNKIYLSGPISGYDLDERRRLFGKTENCLSNNGYEVFNPLKNGLSEDALKSEHMRADIRNLTECDAIVFLPRWEYSAGCRTEFIVAACLKLKVFLVHDQTSSIMLSRIDVYASPDCDAIDFLPGMDVWMADGSRAGVYARMSMKSCFALGEERSSIELKCVDE